MVSQKQLAKAVISGFIVGAAIFIVLIATVFLTGNTFGQRCAAVYDKNDVKWQACVNRLKNGGGVFK